MANKSGRKTRLRETHPLPSFEGRELLLFDWLLLLMAIM
jgi:hypothetical protein